MDRLGREIREDDIWEGRTELGHPCREAVAGGDIIATSSQMATQVP